MTPYVRNRNCSCVRCRAHGLMGPAVLVTLGVLFLLDNYRILRFHESFPVLFLVIGCVLLISRTGSIEGHIEPQWMTGAVPPPAPQQQWTSGEVPPPPPPTDPNDSQVKP